MKKKKLLTGVLVGLGMIGVIAAAGAAPVDAQQAAKVATTEYPGKVLGVTPEDSPEGRKQFAVIVKSGVYERKVMVDIERGQVDMIYYRIGGRTAWVAKKVPLGTKLTSSNGTTPTEKPNP
jgi:hypothetical protein